MTRRENSELLLVGSLPTDSTDQALRAAAGFFGDLVFALPDGETGSRSAWVGYERERLVRPNPGVVVVQETESPSASDRRDPRVRPPARARTGRRPSASTPAWSAQSGKLARPE